MQIPHLAHLGQSRLHTLSLVPEGPHGDAVLPHEAPHSTTITLHAWISEVQWLWGPCHCPGPWASSQPEDGSCLELSGHFLLHEDEKTTVPKTRRGEALTLPGHCRFLAELSRAGLCCFWRTDWSSRPWRLSVPHTPDPVASAQP